jgi:hypothetical protein
MNVEMMSEHEATPAKAPVQEAIEGQPAPEPVEEKLTAENMAERAAKATEKHGVKKDEEKPVSEEKEVKTEEKPVEMAEKAVEYKVNPKFIALGKEYDLPKWAQEAIKNADSEKEVKEVFEKSFVVDHFKGKNQELNEKHSTLQKTYTELSEGVHELREIYQSAVSSGNLIALDDFFAKLKIPPQVILQYAAQRINLEEMPQDQRYAIESSLQAQRRARDLEKQNQSYQMSAQQAEAQARAMQLQSVLAKPDIAQSVQAFDSAPGRKPGDFWNRVREHGEYTWFKHQKDLSPEEAVTQVLAMYGVQGQQATPAAQPQQPATQPVAAAPHRDVPVIPNVSGKSSSPMKQTVKSIDDLRERYKQYAR